MLRLVSIFIFAIFMSSGFAADKEAKQGKLQHIVMCWLKKDADRSKFIESVKSLKEIPQVQAVSIGKNIAQSEKNFDISFIITLKSTADLKAYEAHPIHVKAVKEVIIPAIAKIQVYDFEEE